MNEQTCPYCGAFLGSENTKCSTCGMPLASNQADLSMPFLSHALPEGHLLNGKYEIVGLLGQGGFGITYRALDKVLKRNVAIKELFIIDQNSRNYKDGKTVLVSTTAKDNFTQDKEKFLEEARAIAAFHHPGIVNIHDIFEENNTAYYVMELLEGQTLGKLIEQKGKLDPQEVLTYARKVCEALIEVHAKGLLHRDIKPDNIFIAQNGRVVLLDFGSARKFAAGENKRMTRLITPGYAPLEQYQQTGAFGPPADFYALAATLWHALTGRIPPDSQERLVKLTIGQSDLEDFANALPADTPAGLKQAILKSLDIKAANRPQSAKEFLDILGDPPFQHPARGGTPATTSKPMLVYHDASGNQRRFILERKRHLIGKSDPETGAVDIDLSGLPQSGYVSRRHAEIYPHQGGWMIHDLGSTNGLFLKKAGENKTLKIADAPVLLEEGDEVMFGLLPIKFTSQIEK